ncbi:hypothetical protein NXW89_31420 [Bacteroides thetaiotaomicron]|nr:hypothetical protein [Bacteroides thetaiotaomicron]
MIPKEPLFGYQFDITKFYESVDQDVLLDAVKKMFKDKILIGIRKSASARCQRREYRTKIIAGGFVICFCLFIWITG